MSDEGEPETRLKAVGFWRPWRGFPSPQWLPRADRSPEERGRIVAYLRSGCVLRAYMGHSWCRFHCGIDPQRMGSLELTDGVWVWPEGLAHYVEEHKIALPEAFLHTMAAHDWKMPEGLESRVPELRAIPSYDFETWHEWSFQFKPWYVFW